MTDETCERDDCDPFGDCRHGIPDAAPCICDIWELMVRGCTCGAMDAERAAKTQS